jgi:hypothetical protein
MAILEQHGLLYLFLDDFFHQILFYFGAVGGFVFLLWEKLTDKPLKWKSVLVWLGLCSFVALFQCWMDEHRNSDVLIGEKAKLTSENIALQNKLDNKQNEVDYLRDHREIRVIGQNTPDPRLTDILAQLTKESDSLNKRSGVELKKGLVGLSKEMIEFLQKQAEPVDQLMRAWQVSKSPDPQERNRIWKEQSDKVDAAMDRESKALEAEMTTNFGPRAMLLLEQVRDKGTAATGVKESDINDVIHICSLRTGGSFWPIRDCSEQIATVAQLMH